MADLVRYRVWCNTNSKWEYLWLADGEAEPTSCPANTNHSIDAAKTSIVERVDDKRVQIKHETVETGGNIKFSGFKVSAPATEDIWTDLDVSFPYDVNLLRGRYFDDRSIFNRGADKAKFCVGPDTTIGVITSDVSANDTVIDVDQTTLDNLEVGYKVRLTDGTNEDYRTVLLVDKAGNQITLDSGTSNSYVASTPTYIKMTVEMAEDIFLGKEDTWVPLEGGSGTSFVPANTVIRASFYNGQSVAKDFFFELEIMY